MIRKLDKESDDIKRLYKKMFDNYTLLGGNGTIPDMVASLFKLPIHQ